MNGGFIWKESLRFRCAKRPFSVQPLEIINQVTDKIIILCCGFSFFSVSKSYINDCSYYVCEMPATVFGLHNSQSVHIHVYKGLWWAFTNPLSQHLGSAVQAVSTAQTKHCMQYCTAVCALPRELWCRHQAQMRQLTCTSSSSMAMRALWIQPMGGKKWGFQKEGLAANIITNKVLR